MRHRSIGSKGVMVGLLGGAIIAGLAFTQGASERISVQYAPGPEPKLTVTNNYSSPITGLLIENSVSSPNGQRLGRQVIMFDPTTHERTYAPIAMGQSHTFQIGHIRGADPAILRPEVKAVVFADETTFGNPDWVDELRAMRQCSFKELGEVEGLLTNAKAGGLDTVSLISLLKQRQQSVKKAIPSNPKTRTGLCRLVASVAYLGPISTLERGGAGGTSIADPQAVIPALVQAIRNERTKLVAVGVTPAEANK